MESYWTFKGQFKWINKSVFGKSVSVVQVRWMNAFTQRYSCQKSALNPDKNEIIIYANQVVVMNVPYALRRCIKLENKQLIQKLQTVQLATQKRHCTQKDNWV